METLVNLHPVAQVVSILVIGTVVSIIILASFTNFFDK
jgi:hypothetical protein